MDMNDSFDKTVRREGAAGLRSFSWAGRELRFCGERTTLHVAGVSYDMAGAGCAPSRRCEGEGNLSGQMDLPAPGVPYRPSWL